MSHSTVSLAVALMLLGTHVTSAQDVSNGQRLTERWCSDCHAVGASKGKTSRIISFAAIAEKPGMNPEMIASFLKLPHATMPNLPLKKSDAQDIAAFIMTTKK